MIEVRKINGSKFFVNPDLIRVIESESGTVLLFIDGQRLMVADTPKEIVDRIIEYRRACTLKFGGAELV